jgi:hypothetical protein
VTPPDIAQGLRDRPHARPLSGWVLIAATGLFYAVFWGVKGTEVDAFYRLQALMFGNGTDAGTIALKVLVDQGPDHHPSRSPLSLSLRHPLR